MLAEPQPDLAPAVGGMIILDYGPTGSSTRHPLHLALTTFDTTPSGPSSDYLYSPAGGLSPTETGVIATFRALGALWAPYYPSDWSLRLAALWHNVGGFATDLGVVPTCAAIAGTAAALPAGSQLTQRVISAFSQLNKRWRIMLRRLAPSAVGMRVHVTPSVGGIDVRDRAWLAYLSGTSGGAVVARDGTRYQTVGRVRTWWDSPLPPPAGTDASGLVVSG